MRRCSKSNSYLQTQTNLSIQIEISQTLYTEIVRREAYNGPGVGYGNSYEVTDTAGSGGGRM